MPAKPRTTQTVTAKAKREAIAKAYGEYPFHPKEGVDDFYYRRRHLAKVEHPEAHGWHDVKYQHAMMDLADAIEKELRIVAKDLIKVIESDVEYHGDARRDQTSYVKV
jgi:hypothetical protein